MRLRSPPNRQFPLRLTSNRGGCKSDRHEVERPLLTTHRGKLVRCRGHSVEPLPILIGLASAIVGSKNHLRKWVDLWDSDSFALRFRRRFPNDCTPLALRRMCVSVLLGCSKSELPLRR